MFFEIRKFPIFRKVDVFSTKMTIFQKTLDMLDWSPFLLHFPKNLKTDQIKEWKLTVLNNRCAIPKKWKWTVKSTDCGHLKRQNVDGRKSSWHYLLSVFELSAWIHRTANFHVKESHRWRWLGSSIFTFWDNAIWIDAMLSRMDRLLSNWSLAFQRKIVLFNSGVLSQDLQLLLIARKST